MLECVINHYSDGNKARFAAILGIKPQTINTWVARNTFDAELIYSKCEGISGDWLLGNGEGEMLRGNLSMIEDGGCDVSVDCNNAILRERVKYLEELLSEKERLINVLMNKN